MVKILIRPRPGSSCYTDEEIDVMKEDIKVFSKLGFNHFVLGALNPTGGVAVKQLERIIKQDKSSVYFHFSRAFDQCEDREKALEQINDLGFKTILTSGGEKSCISVKGLKALRITTGLVKTRQYNMEIIAGGGLKFQKPDADAASISACLNGVQTLIKESCVGKIHGSFTYGIKPQAETRLDLGRTHVELLPNMKVFDSIVDFINSFTT